MDNVPKETPVVSVMTLQHLETVVVVQSRKKDDRSSPASLSKCKESRRGAKTLRRIRRQRGESSSDKTKSRFHVDSEFVKNCNFPSCKCPASSRVSELQIRKRLCLWRQMPLPTC